jgi:hypothetical protein
MLRLAAGTDAAALDNVMRALAALVGRIEGCSGFCAGPNRDYEGKSPGYAYGFTLDARDAAALAVYAVDPDHLALAARLVAMCQGGADGIMVFDIEAPA